MTRIAARILSLSLLFFASVLVSVSPDSACGNTPRSNQILSDSLYDAHHPRLLFTNAELPGLYNKVRDGGYDDDAYNFIRLVTQYIYPSSSEEELLDGDFGLETMPNLGLAGFLESPIDTNALALGRNLTTYVADNYAVDDDVFYSSLRLRSLALGYDMFFDNSPESLRTVIRNEIISYIDSMTATPVYSLLEFRPYLSNKAAMAAAAIGMAAICLSEETDSARVVKALTFADNITDIWLFFLVDPDGSYNEGVLYASWSLRNLIYYFRARYLYDGYDYSKEIRIHTMEDWFAYELLPEGSGRTNNLNTCQWNDFVLSQHHTYFDWMQIATGSNLAAWLYEHTAGPYGWDWGLKADKAATVIWNQNLPPEPPQNTLRNSKLWYNRGLYYYRSGWHLDAASDDVVFSFYSGKFQGGHAQEDQGQFTLYGYGAKFAIDHGSGSPAKQSEAHNMVLIDGIGQHNAGSSIGTDGAIDNFLISEYADCITADLAEAYTTYSFLNTRDYPFIGADWSWGYDGGNPVNYAKRTVIAVHDTLLPPYFILIDDIEKDGLPHDYEWRMHTHDANTIDTATNPVQITSGTGSLDMYLISPAFDSVQTSVAPFNNLNPDPDALVLSLSTSAVSPTFALLLFPKNTSVPAPAVSWENQPWGFSITLDWGGGITDTFIRNISGGTIMFPAVASASGDQTKQGDSTEPHGSAASFTLSTDAPLAVTRTDGTQLKQYLLSKATNFEFNDTTYMSTSNGPLSCALSGNRIELDRYDADFTFYAPGVEEAYYRNQKIYVEIDGSGYVTPDPLTGVTKEPPPRNILRAKAFPNPFNPATTILVDLADRSDVEAVIYDLSGRRVKHLWSGSLPSGISALQWKGTNDDGNRVASGVYFLRIQTPATATTLKLVLIK
jgi:hypothetical protein